MKKNSRYFLSLALFLPCMFWMIGCGAPQITGFSVYIGGQPVSESNKTINVTYGDELSLDERMVVKKTLSNNTEQVIPLGENGYSLTSGIAETPTVGVYDLTVSYGLFAAVDIKVEVHKRALAKPTLAVSTLEYSGEAQTVQLDGFDTTYMEITEDSDDLAQTDLTGESGYIVRVQLKDSTNCEWAGDVPDGVATLQWYIIKKSGKISEVSDISKTYDGTAASAPTFTQLGDGEATIEYRQGNEPFSTTAPTDAGDYFVRISIAETEMFGAVSEEKYFEISKANDIITPIIENIDKIYDGDAVTAPTFDCLGDGTKTVQYRKATETYNDLTEDRPVEPGDYMAVLGVSGSKNYEGVSLSVQFTIDKITLTLTASSTGHFALSQFDKKKYDGNYILGVGAERFRDFENYEPFTWTTNGLTFDITTDGTFAVVAGYSATLGSASGTLNLYPSSSATSPGDPEAGEKFIKIGYTLNSEHFKLAGDLAVLIYSARIDEADILPANVTVPTVNRVAKGLTLAECEMNEDGIVKALYSNVPSGTPSLNELYGSWVWEDQTQVVESAGDYNAIFTSSRSFNPITCQVSVDIYNRVEKPTVNESVYTGNLQDVSLVGFDNATMELLEYTQQTAVGTYQFKIGLKDIENYTWDDDSTEPLELEWSIVTEVTVSGKEIKVTKEYDSTSVLPGAAAIVFGESDWLFTTNYVGSIADLGTFNIVEAVFYLSEDGIESMSEPGTGFFKLVLSLTSETYSLKNTTLWFEAEILDVALEVKTAPTYYKALDGFPLTYALIDSTTASVVVDLYNATTGWSEVEVAGAWSWEDPETAVTEDGTHKMIFTPNSTLYAPIEISVTVEIQSLDDLLEIEFYMDAGWLLSAVALGAEGHILVPGSWSDEEGAEGDVFLDETTEGIIANNDNIIKITFGEGITILVKNTVVNCINLSEIILPSTLVEISAGAISGCTSLQYLVIPSRVKIVDFNGFDSGLTIYVEGKASEKDFEKFVTITGAGPTIVYQNAPVI